MDLKENIVSFMRRKQLPVDIEEIEQEVGNTLEKKEIYTILQDNNEFFCLTKKVWYLTEEINKIVMVAIKDLTVTGNTNKNGQVAFKEIYDYVRKKLDRSNISMYRLSHIMENNSKLKYGKNTRWWQIDGYDVNNDLFSKQTAIDSETNTNLKEFYNIVESLSYEQMEKLIMEYYNDIRVPVTEEELIEDIKCILLIDIEPENQKEILDEIKNMVNDILYQSGKYMKTDNKRWVPRNFIMYDEYKSNFKEQLENILMDFEERHIYIFKARNGINTKRITYQAIGDELGISKQRVTQIYEKVIEKTKKHSRAFKTYGYILYDIVQKGLGVIRREELYKKIEQTKEFEGINADAIVWMYETKVFTWYVKYNNMLDIFYINDKDLRNMFKIVEEIFEQNKIEEKTSIININSIIEKCRRLKKQVIEYYLYCYPYTNQIKEDIFYIKKAHKLTRFDYIYMILYKEGQPIHFDKLSTVINSEFMKNYEPRDIQSALISHVESFSRDGVGTYGLRKWRMT